MTKILGPAVAGVVFTCLGLPAMAEPLADATHPADPTSLEASNTGTDPFAFALPLTGPRTPSPSFGIEGAAPASPPAEAPAMDHSTMSHGTSEGEP